MAEVWGYSLRVPLFHHRLYDRGLAVLGYILRFRLPFRVQSQHLVWRWFVSTLSLKQPPDCRLPVLCPC